MKRKFRTILAIPILAAILFSGCATGEKEIVISNDTKVEFSKEDINKFQLVKEKDFTLDKSTLGDSTFGEFTYYPLCWKDENTIIVSGRNDELFNFDLTSHKLTNLKKPTFKVLNLLDSCFFTESTELYYLSRNDWILNSYNVLTSKSDSICALSALKAYFNKINFDEMTLLENYMSIQIISGTDKYLLLTMHSYKNHLEPKAVALIDRKEKKIVKQIPIEQKIRIANLYFNPQNNCLYLNQSVTATDSTTKIFDQTYEFSIDQIPNQMALKVVDKLNNLSLSGVANKGRDLILTNSEAIFRYNLNDEKLEKIMKIDNVNEKDSNFFHQAHIFENNIICYTQYKVDKNSSSELRYGIFPNYIGYLNGNKIVNIQKSAQNEFISDLTSDTTDKSTNSIYVFNKNYSKLILCTLKAENKPNPERATSLTLFKVNK